MFGGINKDITVHHLEPFSFHSVRVDFNVRCPLVHFNKSTTPLSDSDKEWLELFDLISSGINPISEHSVSVEQGIYMTENLVYGREKWQKMKKCVEPHVKLPSQHKLRQFRDEYHPKTGT